MLTFGVVVVETHPIFRALKDCARLLFQSLPLTQRSCDTLHKKMTDAAETFFLFCPSSVNKTVATQLFYDVCSTFVHTSVCTHLTSLNSLYTLVLISSLVLPEIWFKDKNPLLALGYFFFFFLIYNQQQLFWQLSTCIWCENVERNHLSCIPFVFRNPTERPLSHKHVLGFYGTGWSVPTGFHVAVVLHLPPPPTHPQALSFLSALNHIFPLSQGRLGGWGGGGLDAPQP